MSTCSFCDGDGETCDLCGGGIGDARVECEAENCWLEFCTKTCLKDHASDHEGEE
jgi:hypothetical protein